MFVRRNAFRSRRAEARIERRRMIASGFSALLVLLVGMSVWYGTRRPEVTIATISVEGGVTVPHETVRAKVESVLSGTYALLIPRHFSYLIPEKELIAQINSIPRVHNAALVRTSRNELQVTFEEYIPYALWCDVYEPDMATSASCVFVNESGYAFAQAPALLGKTLVRFIVEGRTPEVGVHIYEADAFARLVGLSDALLERRAHRLLGFTETKDGDRMLHLSGNVEIRLTNEADLDDAFTKIESILDAPEYEGLSLDDFEYIDLRFGNTVYVKRRGAEASEVPIEGTSTPSASSDSPHA